MAKNTVLDSASFSLIRTDARLTGNIKLTVDSYGALWLNTIDGNDFLSNDSYKHRAVIDGWSHPMNISRFLSADTENAIKLLYDVRQDVDPNMLADNLEYEHQYDFSEYFAGARYLKSPHYSEKMSYFAPIYLNGTDIPEYFIILKVDGAINGNLIDIVNNKEAAYTPNEYMYEILSRSTIIKTFDMGISSRIGMYLRNMVNDPNFPDSGLKVNFNDGMFTKWCGISIADGVYSDAGELLHDFYSERKPIKIFEEYITNGYKRHGLLHPNIINMEFLFDDETSEVFDHNRYVGFYVNQCELAKFMSGARKQVQIQDIVGNYPEIYNDIHQYKCLNAEINNDSGVCINVYESDITSDITDILTQSKDRQIIPYIKDKLGNFHEVKEYSFDDYGKLDYVRIKDKKVQYCNFVGSDDIQVVNDYGINDTDYSRSFVYIKFNEVPSTGDSLFIYHDNGTHIDEKGRRYDKILFSDSYDENVMYCGDYYSDIIVENELPADTTEYSYKGGYVDGMDEVNIRELINENGEYLYSDTELVREGELSFVTGQSGRYLVYDDSKILLKDSINTENQNTYIVGSCGGYQHLDRFTEGLANCVNTIPHATFMAYGCDGEFILVYQAGGDFDGSFAVKPDLSSTDAYSIIGTDNGEGIFYSFGGSKNKNTLVISSIYENVINTDQCVRMSSYHARIEKICRRTNLFSFNMEKESVRDAFNAFNDHLTLVLSEDEPALVADGKYYITSLFKISLGCFSFYRIKDFDFDTFSTRYSETTYWDKYKYMVPEGVKYLSPYNVYRTVGDFNVVVDGCNVNYNEDGFYITPINGENDSYYSYKSSNSTETTYVEPLYYVLCDGKKVPIYEYDGYSGVKIYSNDNDERPDNTVCQSPLVNNISCEYDYYSENYYINDENRDGSLVQYVCKWAMKNGNDAFNNPYRLNTSDAFGVQNLSPEETNSVDYSSYTNSWMYLVSNFYNSEDNYCYINKPFELNDDFNFDDYFTIYIDGKYRYLYSPIVYNSVSGMCETFFRGKKLLFKTYDDNGIVVYGDNSYDGYKFSALLVPKRINPDKRPLAPVDYVLVKNDKQKYILYYINLDLDDNKVNHVGEYEDASTIVGPNYVHCGVYSKFVENTVKYIPSNGFIVFDVDIDDVSVLFESLKDADTDGINIIGAEGNPGIYAGDILYCVGHTNDSYFGYEGSGSSGADPKLVTLTMPTYRIIRSSDLGKSHGDDCIYSHLLSLYFNKDKCIDADYRISFDDNGLCSLTYTDMYSMKSKKFGPGSGQYSTIEIPAKFKIQGFSEEITIKSYPVHYNPNLFNIFNIFDPNCPIVIEYGNTYDTLLTFVLGGDTPLPTSAISRAGTDVLYTNYNDDENAHKIGIQRFTLDNSYEKYIKSYSTKQDRIYQVCGGVDYFSNNLFKLINFNYALRALNPEYGFITKKNCANMDIVEDSPSIISTKGYVSISDVFSDDNVKIGMTYSITERPTAESISNTQYLYRYSGGYDPLFVDVIGFGSDSDERYNVYFNSDDDSFAQIKNFPHLKVSNGSIIDPDISKSSVLTGCYTVGYSDIDILHTSWDLDFHKKYTSMTEYENVPGTMRINEDDTFINNIIILPDSISLTKFDAEMVSDVYAINMVDKEITYTISNDEVFVRVNYKNVIIDKLIEMGIMKSFSEINVGYDGGLDMKYLGMDINTYVRKYIETNILSSYEIDTASIYYKVSGKSGFSISSSDLKDEDMGNFAVDRNVKIKDCGDYIVEFVYHLNGNYKPIINFTMDLKLV